MLFLKPSGQPPFSAYSLKFNLGGLDSSSNCLPCREMKSCTLRCRLGEAKEVLAKLLGAPVKTYVTRCALLELKELGASFAGALARPTCLCCLSRN